MSLRYKFKYSEQEFTGVPIIASNMDTIGGFEMAKALHGHGLFTTVHKHYTPEEWVKFASENKDVLKSVAISTGIGPEDYKRLNETMELVPEIGYICIDVANGYTDDFCAKIKAMRTKYPKKTIIAGNVVTPEAVHRLILEGADIVKVGIGPGSVCTTRKKTGVGRGQLTAVMECAEAAKMHGGHVISDGGCTVPGDVCKAFGAGASFVMLGGMFAGHDQCPGDFTDETKKYKFFYGMASKKAQEKYNAGLANYRSSEGKVVKVPARGDVSETILDVLGGLRSCCAYVGAFELSELQRHVEFERVTFQTNEVFTHFEVQQ